MARCKFKWCKDTNELVAFINDNSIGRKNIAYVQESPTGGWKLLYYLKEEKTDESGD